MDHIEALVISNTAEKPEEGYLRASDIVEWHVQSDMEDLTEGSLDGCGSCGCGCGGCTITL